MTTRYRSVIGKKEGYQNGIQLKVDNYATHGQT